MSWKNDQVSQEETGRILELAKSVLDVEGDYVELGCYKGDTSLMLAEILVEKSVEKPEDKMCKTRGKPVEKRSGGKRLWIYDSFEGLPEKGEEDKSILGALFRGGELAVTKKEVKQRFLKAGLPVPVIKKGWFAELAEADLPEMIAFAFLDGDFYESIRDSLRLVESRMSEGGVIVIHDYSNPALPGVKKAVDEWGVVNKGTKYKLILL